MPASGEVVAALQQSLLATTLLLLAVAAAIVLRRATRRWTERRQAALAAPLRPVLLRLAAGEPEEVTDAVAQLSALDATRWGAVESGLTQLLLKVRGETHGAVVEVLERRGVLDRARAATGSRRAMTRARGAALLGAAHRRDAREVLERLLSDRNPDVRQVAARALGRIGDPRAAAALVAALGGPLAVPPQVVATALVSIAGGAEPVLVAALSASDPVRRTVVADICGLTGVAAAVSTLEQLVVDDPEPEVRVRCARALGRIGMPRSATALVRAAAAAPAAGGSALLAAECARGLGEIGGAAVVAPLVALAATPRYEVLAAACTALVGCGAAGTAAVHGIAAGGGYAAAVACDVLATQALRSPTSQGSVAVPA